MVNYYHILGLSQTASQAEIKTAYRKLALRYHPDKNGGSQYAEERFKQISQAYRVLSNPRQKAHHDWSLEYQMYQHTQQATAQPSWEYATSSGRHRRGRQRNYPFSPPVPTAINSRQNIVATAWAFGIFFVIALFVVGLNLLHAYQEEQRILEEQLQAQELYVQAQENLEEGDYLRSMEVLDQLALTGHLQAERRALFKDILAELEQEGIMAYESGRYREAAQLLEILSSRLNSYEPIILARLVASYEALQDYEGAVRAYKAVIEAEPRTIEARNRLGYIYAEHYGEFDTAMDYYLQASELAEKEYKEVYGKAYALVLNPAKTPLSHYQLHCGLARVYIAQGMLEQAESALKWAIFLRPEEAEAYFLKGLKHREASEKRQACQAWKQAAKKGYSQAEEYLSAYCQG